MAGNSAINTRLSEFTRDGYAPSITAFKNRGDFSTTFALGIT